jgi:nucleoside phosphorylase
MDKEHIRRYWFGVEDPAVVAATVLLMERDRLEQYRAALDVTVHQFGAVFKGISGTLSGEPLTVIHSIGPAHIADCVSFLVRGFGVSRIISTGSVGGLLTGMGDIVLSSSCTTIDGYSLRVRDSHARSDPVLGRIVEVDLGVPICAQEATVRRLGESFGCRVHIGRMFTVPAVCLECSDTLHAIRDRGHVALDLETGPFLAACHENHVKGICVHWVTDLPLERDFYYPYYGDLEVIRRDRETKHRQWLNLPKLILPLVSDWLRGQECLARSPSSSNSAR